MRKTSYSATLATLLLGLSSSIAQTAGPNTQPSWEAASLPDAPLPQSADPAQPNDKDAVSLRNIPIHFLQDQGVIWTSPARIRAHDTGWLIVLGVATAAAISSDHQAVSSVVSHDAHFNDMNVKASDVLTGGFIAAPVVLMAAGLHHPDSHAKEAGLLGGEAILDGLVVEQGIKLIFWRERPGVDQDKGKFFQKSVGIDSSFPSSHSVLTWCSAAVLADEYPTKLAQLGIYTLATGVSLTRVLGQQHFPSDVLIGSAAGWLVGHYVYRKHHRIRRDDWMQ